ncbi:MAG: hypothetical protein KGY99_06255 [Phycisphaerae bacterium]|nr:hypothetical protein [Phycisphaerae bacterium]
MIRTGTPPRRFGLVLVTLFAAAGLVAGGCNSDDENAAPTTRPVGTTPQERKAPPAADAEPPTFAELAALPARQDNWHARVVLPDAMPGTMTARVTAGGAKLVYGEGPMSSILVARDQQLLRLDSHQTGSPMGAVVEYSSEQLETAGSGGLWLDAARGYARFQQLFDVSPIDAPQDAGAADSDLVWFTCRPRTAKGHATTRPAKSRAPAYHIGLGPSDGLVRTMLLRHSDGDKSISMRFAAQIRKGVCTPGDVRLTAEEAAVAWTDAATGEPLTLPDWALPLDE